MPKTPPERSDDQERPSWTLLWLLLFVLAGLALYALDPDLWLLWLAL